MKDYYIGFDCDKTVGSATTMKQIKEILEFPIDLEYEGKKQTWADFFCDDPRCVFRSIYEDRKVRVDNKTFMTNRPAFAVVTAENGTVIRIQYFEGYNGLSLVYDVRSKKYQSTYMKPYINNEDAE